MKKNIAFSIAGLAALPIGIYFAFTSSDSQIDAITSKEDVSSLEVIVPVEYIASNVEKEAAQRDIGEIADESILIMRMIEMALQKVNIDEEQKAGITPGSIHRIQMTKGNIYYVKQHIDSIEISRNTKIGSYSYENILNRWLDGNFDHIEEETKFLISMVSKPYGKYNSGEITEKNRVEEQEYIQEYFSHK